MTCRATLAAKVPLVWRAPEGLAAAPVGGYGPWQGFGMTRRATSAAKAPLVWRSLERQEGPVVPPTGTPSMPAP